MNVMDKEKRLKRIKIISCIICDLLSFIVMCFKLNVKIETITSTEILIFIFVFIMIDTLVVWVCDICN